MCFTRTRSAFRKPILSPYLVLPLSGSQETNSLKLLEAYHFILKSEIAFQFTCRLRQPFRQHTCCSSLDFAFWSGGFLTKEEKEKPKERERQEKRSLSNALHWTMSLPHHSNVSAECLSDSLQQILKCDNGPQKWVMVSFCWFHFPDPPYPPGLCTSIN